MLDTFSIYSFGNVVPWHDPTASSRCLSFSPKLACFTDELGAVWHCVGYVDTKTIQRLFQAARQLGGYHIRASEQAGPFDSDCYPVWIDHGRISDCSAIWKCVREIEDNNCPHVSEL